MRSGSFRERCGSELAETRAPRRWDKGCLALLAAGLLLLTGGCPIDTDQLIADLVQAGLESATNSLVETLSTYLAGN